MDLEQAAYEFVDQLIPPPKTVSKRWEELHNKVSPHLMELAKIADSYTEDTDIDRIKYLVGECLDSFAIAGTLMPSMADKISSLNQVLAGILCTIGIKRYKDTLKREQKAKLN